MSRNRKLRILVVDDSDTARSLLCAILSDEPDMEVVGEALNGRDAVTYACRLKPDVITMDMYMPVQDGLAATSEILVSCPTPIVIVSSAADSTEIDLSFKATAAGALTVVAKPDGPRSPDFEMQRRELVRMIRAMADVSVVRRWNRRATPPESAHPKKLWTDGRPISAIAIAASTGGPVALQSILSRLPSEYPVPILIVQHIARDFVEGLARWLAASTRRDVKVAEDGELLRRGTVYIAPDCLHLGVSQSRRVMLSKAPAVGGFRPSATFLFQSVAAAYGPRAVGIIMTGMGSDGVEGLRALRRAGGHVIAQDEASSIVFGMPREAINAGIVNAIMSIDEIAEHLRQTSDEVTNAR